MLMLAPFTQNELACHSTLVNETEALYISVFLFKKIEGLLSSLWSVSHSCGLAFNAK